MFTLMGIRTIEWDRQKLYEQVWQKTGVQLAKEYGISDVALAKICRKLNVPRPKPGDWTRMQYGHEVNKPALPAMQNPPKLISRIPVLKEYEKQQPEAYVALKEADMHSPRVEICPDSKKLHLLAAQSLRALHKGQPYQGIIQASRRESLEIEVSQGSVERAVKIADAIIRTLEERGHEVKLEPEQKHSTVVQIERETVAFRIKEKISWVKRELTREEKQQQERWAYPTAKYNYVPTGQLTVEITRNDGWGLPQSKWSDSKRQRLEEKLNDVVVGLIYAGMHKKQQRLEVQQRERERQEFERQRWQRLEGIRAEEERIDLLKRQAENWHASQRIRRFVEAVRNLAQGESIQAMDGRPVPEWTDWALGQADRLDPLKPNPPSILDEKSKWQRH